MMDGKSVVLPKNIFISKQFKITQREEKALKRLCCFIIKCFRYFILYIYGHIVVLKSYIGYLVTAPMNEHTSTIQSSSNDIIHIFGIPGYLKCILHSLNNSMQEFILN